MKSLITSFSSFSISAASAQWIGAREQQEDFCALHPIGGAAPSMLALLADGMGGVADGEKASKHLVENYAKAYQTVNKGDELSRTNLTQALQKANLSLGEMKSRGCIHEDAGATFISFVLNEHGFSWLSVGDSLIYRQRGNEIKKINEAHTWEWELARRVRSGQLTPEAAASMPGPRHALFAAVCGSTIKAAEIAEKQFCQIGDRYIIASDGLQPLIDSGWEQWLRRPEVRHSAPHRVCELLLSELRKLQNPRQDNTSIIIIDILSAAANCDHCAAVSEIGDRDSQQDAEACWKSENAMLAVVTDGAGGHAGGERASRAAINSLQRIWQAQLAYGVPAEHAQTILSQALYTAHNDIVNAFGGNAKNSGKCAIVALYLHNGHYTVANVGDCRAYVSRKGVWQQLTTDDTLLRLLLERGDVTPENAHNHPDQNVLTQALGGGTNLTPHIHSGRYKLTDSFLLCCDGLWHQLPQELWNTQYWNDSTLTDCRRTLHHMVQCAISAAGGKSDNVSALWLHANQPGIAVSPWYTQQHILLSAIVAATLLITGTTVATCSYVANKQAQAEAARQAKIEAEQKAKEEAKRKAEEEAARKAKEEAERKAREEAEKKAKEEADKKAREEAERQKQNDAQTQLHLNISSAKEDIEKFLSDKKNDERLSKAAADYIRTGESPELKQLLDNLRKLVSELRAHKPAEVRAHIDASSPILKVCQDEEPTDNQLMELFPWQTKLYEAAKNQLKEKKIAEKDINTRFKKLLQSRKNIDEHLMRILLFAGADVNTAMDKKGNTLLLHAVEKQQTERIKLLLMVPGIDVNKTNTDKETPLHLAAKAGHKESVQLLLAMPGLNVNVQEKNGITPLYEAAVRGHAECVKLLLEVPDINVNLASNIGWTPLKAAKQNQYDVCADLISEKGGKEELEQGNEQ